MKSHPERGRAGRLSRRFFLTGGGAGGESNRSVTSTGRAPASDGEQVVEQPPLPRVISWLAEYQNPTSQPSTLPVPAAVPGRSSGLSLALHRPPGAVSEEEFLQRCTRCNRCAEACLHHSIEPAPGRYRQAAGTPLIDARSSPCHLCEDLPCVEACDTGALAHPAGSMGVAHLSAFDCLNAQGGFCASCVEHCPVPGAIELPSPAQSAASKRLPKVSSSLCVGCGICVHRCPAPGGALSLLPLRQRPAAVAPGEEGP